MTKLYRARWVLPLSSEPIFQGAIVVQDQTILAVGSHADLAARFTTAPIDNLGEAAIIPGLVNTHSHLERMTADDLYISAVWGVCEAARAGVTCVADASDGANQSMKALRDSGLRG